MMYLLDTHTWIWWNAAPDRLSPKAREAIENESEVLLSAISPWELAKLLERGRLTLAVAGDHWLRSALSEPSLRLVPVSPEISWHSTQLPPPFHEDPADQIVVATARLLGATIITKDRLIRNYAHVASLW